jgi:hypothetical protein
MTDLLDIVRTAWGWTGIDPAQVVATSAFGHLVIRDTGGFYWYLDPELRELQRVAADRDELTAYMNQPHMIEAWFADRLTAEARERFGEPEPGRCYSFETRALIEGDYAPGNLRTIPIAELIAFVGDFEQKTRDLPEGTPIRLEMQK